MIDRPPERHRARALVFLASREGMHGRDYRVAERVRFLEKPDVWDSQSSIDDY
jgi:hypothetical protein